MRKFNFESSVNEDRVVVSFRETSLQETIDKFFGLLRASGYNEDVVKSSAKDVIEGRWINNLSGLLSPIGLNNLTISSITSSQLSALTSSTYSAPLSSMNNFK